MLLQMDDTQHLCLTLNGREGHRGDKRWKRHPGSESFHAAGETEVFPTCLLMTIKLLPRTFASCLEKGSQKWTCDTAAYICEINAVA